MNDHRYPFEVNLKSSNDTKDPYETIKIIQKNLINDFDEIIAEKSIYDYLLNADIENPLYHIEKLSELVGKAKVIIKSKVYKPNRRILLQKAIDLFVKVKDRLSAKLIEALKNTCYKRKISDTSTEYDDSPKNNKNSSLQEDLRTRKCVDSIILNRQRLTSDVNSEEFSEEYYGEINNRNNLRNKNQFLSEYQATRFTPCISPPLSRSTPLYNTNDNPFNESSTTIRSTCISPVWDACQKTTEPNNYFKDFANFDDSVCSNRDYYHEKKIESNELSHQSTRKINHISSTESSQTITKSGDFTQRNHENTARYFQDDLKDKLNIIYKKVEATKRDINDVIVRNHNVCATKRQKSGQIISKWSLK